jgi:hypothetical protein
LQDAATLTVGAITFSALVAAFSLICPSVTYKTMFIVFVFRKYTTSLSSIKTVAAEALRLCDAHSLSGQVPSSIYSAFFAVLSPCGIF